MSDDEAHGYEQQKRQFFNSCTAERNRFITSKGEESKTYDKTVLSFSAGAIGVSLTFLEKIAPGALSPWLLYGPWSCFALAILSVVLSFVLSQAAMDVEIAWLHQAWAAVSAGEKELPARTANRPSKFTRGINWCSGLLFFGGVILLVVFGGRNWPSPAQPIGGKMTAQQISRQDQGANMRNTSSNTGTSPTNTRGNTSAPALVQPAPQPPVQSPTSTTTGTSTSTTGTGQK